MSELEGVIIVKTENVTSERQMLTYGPKTGIIAYGTFLSAVGTFLDIIVLVALIKSVSNTKGTSRVLMGLLCCVQLLALLLVVPLEIAREYLKSWPLNGTVCKVWTVATHTIVPLMLWTCTALCIDRIVRLRRLNNYVSRDKRCKVPCLLIGVGLLCCISMAPLISWIITQDLILVEVCAVAVDKLYTPVLTSLCYFLPTVVCITSLVLLTVVTKRKVQQLTRLGHHESVAVLNLRSHFKAGQGNSLHIKGCVSEVRNSRLCVTCLTLVCVLAWAPFYLANLKITFCDHLCLDPRLWTLLMWLGYSSFLVCPPLFLIDNRLRLAVKSWISSSAQDAESLYSRSSFTSEYSSKP